MHPHLEETLATVGIIDRRAVPALRSAVDEAVRSGRLVRVLPSIYARPAEAATLLTRARAVCTSVRDAVVTGWAAAVLGGWTDLGEPDVVDVASLTQKRPRPGFRFERRVVPRSLTKTVDGVRMTTFPATALDLAASYGDDRIDDALRRGVDPAKLRAALAACPRRRGWGGLRRVVHAVRDRPWSPLERDAHELLRGAHIGGWQANRCIYARGDPPRPIGYGDLVFRDVKLIIELDGAEHHTAEADRARDEHRDLRLARLGWEVIRLRGSLVARRPEMFVALVRDIVRTRNADRLDPRTVVTGRRTATPASPRGPTAVG